MPDWLDWGHLIAAVTGGAFIAFKSLIASAIRAPAQIVLQRYKVVRALSRTANSVPYLKSAVYSDRWEITWIVESSDHFPRENRDVVTVYKFLNQLAAEMISTTKEGQKISYAFTGTLHGDVITGQWLDNRNDKAAYYGAYQLVMKPTLGEATGKWIGFSSKRHVNAHDLTWRKLG